MELSNFGLIAEHIFRFLIIILGITFAVVLGRFRPEWRSRKTLICWVWSIVAADIIIMDGQFALSLTAQLFISGALVLNVINFIGDRIETIKFKDFTASLKSEPETPVKPIQYVTEDPNTWPDGGSVKETEETKVKAEIPKANQ
jgi:hypothetical protein